MALLEVHGLVKFYGRRAVVNGVDFEVNAGEVVGLLGPNGAGKTTSFRMATGQLEPNKGKVYFNGNEVTDLAMYLRARLGMGYLTQETSVFRRLTVEQNVLAILEVLPKSAHPRPAAQSQGALGAHREGAGAVRPEPRPQEFGVAAVRRREAPARDRPLPGVRATAGAARRAVRRGRSVDQGGHSRDGAGDGEHGHRRAGDRPRRARGAQDHDAQLSHQGRQGPYARHPGQIVRDPIAIAEYLGAGFNDNSFANPDPKPPTPPAPHLAALPELPTAAPPPSAQRPQRPRRSRRSPRPRSCWSRRKSSASSRR